MDYILSIKPGISPSARHKLEDKVDAFLAKYGGETTGGGTMVDGSESDLDFECNQADFQDSLPDFLVEHANINATISLSTLDDSEVIFAVDCEQNKSWWRFW